MPCPLTKGRLSRYSESLSIHAACMQARPCYAQIPASRTFKLGLDVVCYFSCPRRRVVCMVHSACQPGFEHARDQLLDARNLYPAARTTRGSALFPWLVPFQALGAALPLRLWSCNIASMVQIAAPHLLSLLIIVRLGYVVGCLCAFCLRHGVGP